MAIACTQGEYLVSSDKKVIKNEKPGGVVMLGNNELVKLSLEEDLKRFSFNANSKPEVVVKEGFKHYFL